MIVCEPKAVTKNHYGSYFCMPVSSTVTPSFANIKTVWASFNIFNAESGNSIDIPVAEQCSSTARIGHRTRAVLSSDKHWHGVPEQSTALHCSSPMTQALLSVLSPTAAVSWSVVTVLGHCHHCLMTQSLLLWKNVTDAEQCSKQYSLSLSCSAQNLLSTQVEAKRSLLGTPWDSVPSTGSKLFYSKQAGFLLRIFGATTRFCFLLLCLILTISALSSFITSHCTHSILSFLW